MTDKVQKIRNEVEKLKSNLMYGACSSQVAMETRCKEEAYNEVLSIMDSMQEEPKECMYSKDNYTAEDRKVLCEDCEEKCKFNKKEEPAIKEQVKESLISKHEDKTCKENGNSLTQEPISDALEQAIDNYLATYFGGEKEKQDWPFLKKMAIHFANWQKKKDDYAIEIAHMAGEEEGKNIMKQQMIAKAVDATVHIDAGGYPYIPQMELYDYEKDIPLAKEGDKYKVILIKED